MYTPHTYHEVIKIFPQEYVKILIHRIYTAGWTQNEIHSLLKVTVASILRAFAYFFATPLPLPPETFHSTRSFFPAFVSLFVVVVFLRRQLAKGVNSLCLDEERRTRDGNNNRYVASFTLFSSCLQTLFYIIRENEPLEIILPQPLRCRITNSFSSKIWKIP